MNRGRLVVLDWGYAAIGNLWFDAAALHRQLGIPGEDIANLPAWQGLSAAQFETGLTLSVWLIETLENLWYTVREQNTGFDAGRLKQAEFL